MTRGAVVGSKGEHSAMNHAVLLVDDDANLLAALKRALRTEPYEILTAGSAGEALQAMATRTVDVVVSDEDMPGMPGTAFLKEVRALYPDTVRIMLTGKATLENALRAINDGGIARFFVKPCDGRELAFSIRQGLQHRELMVAARRLLKRSKRQSTVIQQLEKAYPSITRVERDDDGAIVIKDAGDDFNMLIQEINAYLDS